MGMLFFCELYVIRDELALLGRTAHHPRSWAAVRPIPWHMSIHDRDCPHCRGAICYIYI